MKKKGRNSKKRGKNIDDDHENYPFSQVANIWEIQERKKKKKAQDSNLGDNDFIYSSKKGQKERGEIERRTPNRRIV